MSVKTAMIGLGIMGRRMAEHMSLHPEYQLSGLWDPNPEACEAAQALPPNAPNHPTDDAPTGCGNPKNGAT